MLTSGLSRRRSRGGGHSCLRCCCCSAWKRRRWGGRLRQSSDLAANMRRRKRPCSGRRHDERRPNDLLAGAPAHTQQTRAHAALGGASFARFKRARQNRLGQHHYRIRAAAAAYISPAPPTCPCARTLPALSAARLSGRLLSLLLLSFAGASCSTLEQPLRPRLSERSRSRNNNKSFLTCVKYKYIALLGHEKQQQQEEEETIK